MPHTMRRRHDWQFELVYVRLRLPVEIAEESA